ncbi:YeeE/YedE family protein [Paracoccus sanguinis]|uniref:YeeE/YedE family protein n=1 Tax=Paracoccus sanguinis TaxID=1545044 RepID=UPI00051FDD48|nr:hypothetical protein [Paracoccus sanguinis]KGJ18192.1 hypothetical protein IX55_11885 [Paracoccus sanguinis]
MPLDWMMGLAGGLMIGLAAAVFLLGTGRIMGASGLIAGVLAPGGGETPWIERALFVLGLVGAPALLVAMGVGHGVAPLVGLPVLVVAGLLVGFGSRLANGCTSGHGVCGVSRLAPRGLAATFTYLGFGVVGVLIGRALGVAP